MDFSKLQSDILAFWQTNSTFAKSNLNKTKSFSFIDGPPFATGEPHYGHLLAGTIKDVICRYQSMNDEMVVRRFGWDCHGLPVENLAQKCFTISSFKLFSQDHANVVAFNTKCEEIITSCKTSWEDTTTKLGRWIDFEDCYRTMDSTFMESVWWAFKEIYSQGRIVKQDRIVPYSPKLQSGLSNSEASHYKEVTDQAVYLLFHVEGYQLVVYTTTPWTLLMNSGLCVNSKLSYSLVNNRYVVATNLVSSLFKENDIVEKFDITSLVGKSYYVPLHSRKGKVVDDDFVTDTTGTGIVHLAPAYGEDDFRVGKMNGLDIIEALDDECKFLPIEKSEGFVGKFCKDANEDILERLGYYIFRKVNITHSYPYCERTDFPIIYRLQSGWVMKLEDIKEELLENNDSIHWVPEAIGKNRFANWLKESKDWNISRTRLWGTPLPLFVSEDGEILCVGSLAELNSLHSGTPVTNLHKQFVDPLVLTKDNKTFKRVPEVLDCWVESGCVPFAQLHYPFENQEEFHKSFPADFIAEGLDQTRGWFYSLLVINTLLFKKAPFKNVIVNGLILAEDGEKMSKSKKNYANPNEILDKHGSDAVRAYLCSSPSVAAEPTKFSEELVSAQNKNLILPLLSAMNFFSIHKKNEMTNNGCQPLDLWIEDELVRLIAFVRTKLDSYELSGVIQECSSFVDKLNNWYIRHSRKNLYTNASSFGVFQRVMIQFCQVLAPMVPFVAEHVYQVVNYDGNQGSVHLTKFPQSWEPWNVFDMKKVQEVTTSLNHFKTSHNHSLNFQVKEVSFLGVTFSEVEEHLVKELNHVGKVTYLSDSEMKNKVTVSYSPNFKVLGKRLGGDMKAVAKEIGFLTAGCVFPMVLNGHEITENDVVKKVSTLDSSASFYAEKWGQMLVN